MAGSYSWKRARAFSANIAAASSKGKIACSSSGRGRSLPRACGSIRSEEHTSELQSLMRISYAVFCLKKKKTKQDNNVQSNKTDTTLKQINRQQHQTNNIDTIST